MSLRITSVWRYPVKSCRGEELTAARVEPWGLAGDRRWMIVDAAGGHVTAREHPRLVLVTPILNGGGHMTLTSPDLHDLVVPVPDGTDLMPVSVWTTLSVVEVDDGPLSVGAGATLFFACE